MIGGANGTHDGDRSRLSFFELHKTSSCLAILFPSPELLSPVSVFEAGCGEWRRGGGKRGAPFMSDCS